MRFSILMTVVLYEILVIVGVSWWINRRNQGHLSEEDFSHASSSLGPLALGATIALTSLGGGHILGLPMQVPAVGMAILWFPISGALMLVLLACFMGPWYRRMGVVSITNLFSVMFNRHVGILITALNCGCYWGVITLELQGVAAVLSIMTGWSMVTCCLLGGVISILYVIFAGMKEVAKVNVINATIMYIGLVIALVYVSIALKTHDGWAGVNAVYSNSGKEWMLSLMSTPEIWRSYIIGTLLGQLVYVPASQAGAQQAMAARSTDTLKKAVMLIVPINTIFGVLTISLGMASNAFSEIWPSTFAMYAAVLPGWALALLLAGFAAAILSTIAVTLLCMTTIFMESIYKPYYRSNIDEKHSIKAYRVIIIVASIVACVIATMLPPFNTSLVWLFAWILAPFFVLVFGFYWKLSTKGAIATIVISSIANCIWTFSDLSTLLNLEGSTNAIMILGFVIVVGVISFALDKNARPSLFSQYKKDKVAVRMAVSQA